MGPAPGIYAERNTTRPPAQAGPGRFIRRSLRSPGASLSLSAAGHDKKVGLITGDPRAVSPSVLSVLSRRAVRAAAAGRDPHRRDRLGLPALEAQPGRARPPLPYRD